MSQVSITVLTLYESGKESSLVKSLKGTSTSVFDHFTHRGSSCWGFIPTIKLCVESIAPAGQVFLYPHTVGQPHKSWTNCRTIVDAYGLCVKAFQRSERCVAALHKTTNALQQLQIQRGDCWSSFDHDRARQVRTIPLMSEKICISSCAER